MNRVALTTMEASKLMMIDEHDQFFESSMLCFDRDEPQASSGNFNDSIRIIMWGTQLSNK